MKGGNSALGDFIRSRRERLDPDALGLATLRRRRTPGLRREEVAEAAGISVEWYVKLEQGRAVTPPAPTINALADALRLDPAERSHLRGLAGMAAAEPFVRERVPPQLRRLVQALRMPAYISGQRWDLLAWNTAAVDLFGDFGEIPVGNRNILLYALTDPRAKALFGAGWTVEARRMVALFRASYDLWSGDPAFTELVVRVRDGCTPFASWWRTHDIRAPVSGTKTLHTGIGVRRFEYATFQANDDPKLRLALYTAT